MKKRKLLLILPVFLYWTGLRLQAEVAPSAFHFDYTDLAVAYTESTPTNDANLALLTDNNEQTIYEVEGVSSVQITVELEYPILLTVYGLASSSGNPVNLADWIIERSMDGDEWTAIEVANIKRPIHEYGTYKTFTTNQGENDEAKRGKFYRLTATGDGKVEIGEWQLHGVPCVMSEDWGWPARHFPNDLMGFIDLTTQETANGTISADAAYTDPYGAPASAISGVFYWGGYSASLNGEVPPTPWLTFEFNEPTKVGTYSITNNWVNHYGNPTAWKLWASNATDDTGWTLLDEQYRIAFPGEGNAAATLMYPVANPAEYKKYKLEVRDSYERQYVINILEWQLFAEENIVSAPLLKPLAFSFDYTDQALSITEENETDEANRLLLTDNDEHTVYKVEGVSSTQLTVKLKYPILLSAYGLASSPDQPVDVSAWTVEYFSLKENAWKPVVLSTESYKPVFDFGLFKTFQTNAYTANPWTYDYENQRADEFRLTATGNGSVEIGEWQLYGLPVVIDGGYPAKHFPEDLIGFPDDNGTVTTPNGAITSDQGYPQQLISKQFAYTGSYDVQRAENSSFITRFTFTFSEPAKAGYYSLSSTWGQQDGKNNISVTPNKWKLWATNDPDGEWTLLDQQFAVAFPTEGYAASTLLYEIAEPAAYTAYKLEVLDNNGNSNNYWDNAIKIQQWQLFAPVYTISVENGTADVSEAEAGTVVEITAADAPEGKRFSRWESEDVEFERANYPVTTFVMPDKNVSINATYEDIPYFTVTVINGTANLDEAAEGETVEITAGEAPSKHVFDQWETDNASIEFVNSFNATTTFVMPDADVTVTATYKGDGSGISVTETKSMLIYSGKGKLIINSPSESLLFSIYNIVGQLIETGLTGERQEIPLQEGVYIVKINDSTTKLIVR